MIELAILLLQYLFALITITAYDYLMRFDFCVAQDTCIKYLAYIATQLYTIYIAIVLISRFIVLDNLIVIAIAIGVSVVLSAIAIAGFEQIVVLVEFAQRLFHKGYHRFEFIIIALGSAGMVAYFPGTLYIITQRPVHLYPYKK